MTRSGPPVAPRGPGADPYAWMRDRDEPRLREYLAAERAYYDAQSAPLRALREDLFAELAARLEGLGAVRANEFALRFHDGEHDVTVFADGRAIVKGTTDVGVARGVYSRYVGN